MGYDTVHFQVVASVSRHNSERDLEDDALWEELCNRIRAICMEHRYYSIGPICD